MAQNALRDENRIPVMLFVGTDGGTYYAKGDEVTGRLYVDLPSGTGDVSGPATNTDNYIPQWDGADSKKLKNGLGLGIADDNVVQIDQIGVADNDYAKFTANGLEGRSYAEVKQDLDLEIGTDVAAQIHASQHAVGGADTVFPADPGADRYLMWDDDPGALVWAEVSGGTDEKVKYDAVDPTAGYVADKIVAGNGISVAEGTGANENKLVITNTAPATIDGSGTINEITYWADGDTLGALPVATYPSLTELSYVKGVTSGIQTQLGNKEITANKVTSFQATPDDSHYTSEKLTYDQLALKAPLASPTFTGTVTTPAIKITGGTPGLGKVLTSDADGDATWETPSGGTSLWTAITGTRASNTTITVATDLTAIFKKGMIVRWQESGVDKVGMVSIPSTYSDPNTTITIIGDTCASIDSNSFKYSSIIGAEQFIKNFAVAGNIGAVATDIANAYYATEPMRVIGADLQVGFYGTTNNTTIDINKGGTTMFTTKPTLATTVASSPTPFTADTATSLALGDRVSIDIDAIQTTNAIDLYVQLYLIPTRYLSLS